MELKENEFYDINKAVAYADKHFVCFEIHLVKGIYVVTGDQRTKEKNDNESRG